MTDADRCFHAHLAQRERHLLRMLKALNVAKNDSAPRS
jgi:hypothetical protein